MYLNRIVNNMADLLDYWIYYGFFIKNRDEN